MKEVHVRTGLILGLLSALGPFAIDMYLPGLPAISQNLNASAASVQASLMAFLVAIAISQLIYGPVSDVVGRKPPIYFGLCVFALASVGCALAPNIEALIGFRALQGVGACAGMVIPRAVVRDLHTGPEAVHLMSILMLVFSVSPILAPVSGSLVVAFAGWRTIFWVIMVAALLGIVLTATQLQETRARSSGSWRAAIRDYGQLLNDRHFIGLVSIGAFAMSAFFIYLANSSFVLIQHYGLSPTMYGLFFAVNAAAFIGAALCNNLLIKRFRMTAIVRSAATAFAVIAFSLVLLATMGFDNLAVVAVFLFGSYACVGLVLPNVTVMAIEPHGRMAGTASALIGAIQLIVATAVIGVAGIFADGSPLPMISAIAACALLVFLLSLWALRDSMAASFPAVRK